MQEYPLLSIARPLSKKNHIMRIKGPEVNITDLNTPVIHRYKKEDVLKVEEQVDEEYDSSTVAPSSAAEKATKRSFFKKKSKTFTFARDDKYGLEDAEDGIVGLKKRELDPDVDPWLLSDQDSKTKYEGRFEAAQSSNYVLFVLGPQGFSIVPVDKWYTFQAQQSYKKLTTEEAEEQMSLMNKKGAHDKWLMNKSIKIKDEAVDSINIGGVSIKLEDDGAGNNRRQQKLRVSDKRNRGDDDDLGDELDFEEDFQDDDGLMQIGIDDEDELREATKRAYGKGANLKISFGDEDDDENVTVSPKKKKLDKQGKKLKKSLIKKGSGVLDSDEEVNPYQLSEDEEQSEDEEEKAAILIEKEKEKLQLQRKDKSKSKSPSKDLKPTIPQQKRKATGGDVNLFHSKKIKKSSSTTSVSRSSPSGSQRESSSSPRGTSPTPKSLPQSPPGTNQRATSPLSHTVSSPSITSSGSSNKKIKLKVGGSSSPPPPPSAKDVLIRIEKERRMSQMSQSPPPQSPYGEKPVSPPEVTRKRVRSPEDEMRSGSGSPSNELESAVIKIFRENNFTMEVSKLVNLVKPLAKKVGGANMKEVLKNTMRKLTEKGGTGMLVLKEELR